MCGLVGGISRVHFDRLSNVLPAMLSKLHHRGPDDNGTWCDPENGVALGHARLSILDLSEAGHQPMFSSSGRYIIVYNGEIYNYRAIKDQLEDDRQSLNWRGHSDTEVLLEAIEAWGLHKTLCLLNGMFAFALWDKQDHSLTLARDRAGEKPLYYGWKSDVFLFGSDLAALALHPDFDKSINQTALGLLMQYSYVPAPHSIYKNIYKLTPGTYLKLNKTDLENKNLTQPEVYWSWKGSALNGLEEPMVASETDATKMLDHLLRDAISKQSFADVSVGSFLSGGVDSSLVTALMQQESSLPIKTFTIGFNESHYNESNYAKEIAAHLGTEHTELIVTEQDALSIVPFLPKIYTEPFADASQIPTVLLSRLTQKSVSVSLSGDAGDELFGGYNRYLVTEALWNKMRFWPVGTRKLAAWFIMHVPVNAWDKAYHFLKSTLPVRYHFSSFGDKLHKIARTLGVRTPYALYEGVASFWDPSLILYNFSSDKEISSQPSHHFSSFTDWMMCQDALTYLPDDILVKVDRAAMFASLETRVPFLDTRVIEFSHRLPLNFKIRQGVSKWLLREVLYQYVPQKLIDRPKMGFAIPLERWLRGPLREWAENLLAPSRLNQLGLFNHKRIQAIWAEHLSGKRNLQYYLWPVLMFLAWREQES